MGQIPPQFLKNIKAKQGKGGDNEMAEGEMPVKGKASAKGKAKGKSLPPWLMKGKGKTIPGKQLGGTISGL